MTYAVAIHLTGEPAQGWVFEFVGGPVPDQTVTYCNTGSFDVNPPLPQYVPGPQPVTLDAGYVGDRQPWVCTGGPLESVALGTYGATGVLRRAVIGEKLAGLVATVNGWQYQ